MINDSPSHPKLLSGYPDKFLHPYRFLMWGNVGKGQRHKEGHSDPGTFLTQL